MPMLDSGLKVQRVTGNIDLVPPFGFRMSVLLRLLQSDAGSWYCAWWAMVGHQEPGDSAPPCGQVDVDDDAIRLDLPAGTPLSAESLEPHLAVFLQNEGLSYDSPVIRT